jgi:hypothetical protein
MFILIRSEDIVYDRYRTGVRCDDHTLPLIALNLQPFFSIQEACDWADGKRWSSKHIVEVVQTTKPGDGDQLSTSPMYRVTRHKRGESVPDFIENQPFSPSASSGLTSIEAALDTIRQIENKKAADTISYRIDRYYWTLRPIADQLLPDKVIVRYKDGSFLRYSSFTDAIRDHHPSQTSMTNRIESITYEHKAPVVVTTE